MSTPRLDPRFIERLAEARQQHCYPVELRTLARAFGSRALALLFPHFVPEAGGDPTVDAVEAEAAALGVSLQRLLASLSRCGAEVPDNRVIQQYLDSLPELYAVLRTDADAIFHGDPAARSLDEVILTYPGFYAIAIFRLAHALHALDVPIIPRLMTEHAHTMTGVDIHPGATIGRSFFIDHGTGVVIGETTVIGNDVKLYQGVTLGALSIPRRDDQKKRHPTLEDNVVVYSNATILGGKTVIGHDSVIGGNAFLTHTVPPFSMVTHETEVRPRGKRPGANGEDVDFHI
ncbi:MAG TPA: serine O-acetyltransferase EpsC [Gemmatimonadaceae bacterium]|nr:serine O-acetyltransferase EpsC [Gemmatimonadaceae bacterium]